MDNEENNNKVNEPQPNSNRLVFFKSFEEMNGYDHKTYAALTPAEALSHVTILRLARYPYLNTIINPWGDTVYID